jgi:hypothetical protein
MFSNFDEERREKAQSIMEKERSGAITREEAQEQLAELGIDMPQGKGMPEQQN